MASSRRVAKALYSQRLEQSTASESTIVFLHGLLGNGRNLRTFASQLCNMQGHSGLLVDLPGHGKSAKQSVTNFEHAVQHIQTTLQNETIDGPLTLVGHSLGGRLSIRYAYDQLEPKPSRIWLLDTVPGAMNESVVRVLEQVRDFLGGQRPSHRKEVTGKLIGHGMDQETAQWLASTYQVDSHEFGFDMSVAEHLVTDFTKQDFLGQLGEVVASGTRVDLVRAGRNNGWETPDAMVSHLQDMEGELFQLHTLPNAGHNVHVDDLPNLLKSMENNV
jgi:thioesterase domain-containing protein